MCFAFVLGELFFSWAAKYIYGEHIQIPQFAIVARSWRLIAVVRSARLTQKDVYHDPQASAQAHALRRARSRQWPEVYDLCHIWFVSHCLRKWPYVYDLCHTFVHFAPVETRAILVWPCVFLLAQRAKTCDKTWYVESAQSAPHAYHSHARCRERRRVHTHNVAAWVGPACFHTQTLEESGPRKVSSFPLTFQVIHVLFPKKKKQVLGPLSATGFDCWYSDIDINYIFKLCAGQGASPKMLGWVVPANHDSLVPSQLPVSAGSALIADEVVVQLLLVRTGARAARVWVKNSATRADTRFRERHLPPSWDSNLDHPTRNRILSISGKDLRNSNDSTRKGVIMVQLRTATGSLAN